MIAGVTIFVVGVLVGAGIYLVIRHVTRVRLTESLSLELLLVKVVRPEEAQKGEDALRAEIGSFEQFLSNLSSMRRLFALEVAVPHVGEEIHFYVAVPRQYREAAMKQIHGLWNDAVVEPVPGDYNIFNSSGAHTAAYLLEKQHFALPLRTYRDLGGDTFAPIANGFTRIQHVGQGASFQIIVRPATVNYKKAILGRVDMLRKGNTPDAVFRAERIGVGALTEAIAPKSTKELREKDVIIDDEAVRAVTAKASKPLFEINARIVASASTPFEAGDIIDGIAAGFAQFSAPQRNEFTVVKPRKSEKLIYRFVFREFAGNHRMIVNSEELASFFHFPTSAMRTPKMKLLKSKEAAPPVNLPASGLLVGTSSFRGESRPIYVSDDDRRRHIYTIGQTGTGKSTLMANMAASDIGQGRGVAMIDPHGDLVETILTLIPEGRMQDVIYFDPSDLWRPLGLNMLEYDLNRPEQKTFIVNEIMGIFMKLFPPETMGPMFEQYMRNALLLLMEDASNESATLMEVPRVFTDPVYRRRKLERIHNPTVVDFWEKEAAKAGGEASLANMTPYVTSKFNNFISNDYMRPIIGQPKSAFDFRDVMDRGKILLVNLSKGRIGDINAGLLGMVVTGKILMAALSRVDMPEEKRRDFNLYIDEFHNFTTDSIATILSEARKYRLSLVMAHQFIAQLTEKIRDAVFGNVGMQVVFRVGAQDAEFLVKQFEPTFNQGDLMSIDNFNAYVRMLVYGETVSPFNIRTHPLTPGNAEAIEYLKKYSRETYGTDRQDIERAIAERLRN